MHVNQCGGGTFINWVTRYSRWCRRTNPAACGALRTVCTMMDFDKRPLSCGDRVREALQNNCTFVELHHYDFRPVEAFKTLGFEAYAQFREPVALAESRANKLVTRFSKEGNASCGGPDCVDPRPGSNKTWRRVSGYAPPLLPVRFLSLCDGEILRRCAFADDGDFASLADASPFGAEGAVDGADCATAEALTAALARFAAFDVVGVLDRLSESFLAFGDHFGLDVGGLARASPSSSRGNPSIPFFKFTAATRAAVRGDVSADGAVYAAAAASLDARVADIRRRRPGAWASYFDNATALGG